MLMPEAGSNRHSHALDRVMQGLHPQTSSTRLLRALQGTHVVRSNTASAVNSRGPCARAAMCALYFSHPCGPALYHEGVQAKLTYSKLTEDSSQA